MSIRRTNPRLQSAVRFALTGVAAASASAAYAADKAAEGAALQEVVITGSRISVPNEVSISPVIAISAEILQSTGATRVEDMLNTLPQVFAAQGSMISNGSDGTAQVNLRGLGTSRTLVLVNGRRLGPGDPGGGSASDLNQIPAELIEKVDVLTGGASSVYGADAVAGVVNFQLNNHFEGVKVSTNYSFYSHHQDNTQGVGDNLKAWNDAVGTTFPAAPANVSVGQTKDVALVFGFNTGDGKGNVTTYATYRNIAAVLQSNYDYSACTIGSGYTGGSYDTGGTFGGCGGSSTSYPGGFRQKDPATGKNRNYNPLTGKYDLTNRKMTIDFANGDALVPFGLSNLYNYGPLNYYQRPDERWTAGTFAHYEFSDHADVYTEIQYMNDRSISQIAPSGAFNVNFTLTCDNPYLSQSMLTTWCGGAPSSMPLMLAVGRRNVEGGGRQSDMEHSAFRIVAGVKGKINDEWSYDVYAQNSITQLAETYLHDLSNARIGKSLNAVKDSAGNIVCASVLDGSDPNCVPWNIFQQGGVTPGALNYLQIPLSLRGEVTQRIVSGNVTGDLTKYGLKVPTAADGVKVNAGIEWRQLKSSTLPDAAYQAGDGAGQGAPTLPVGGQIISRDLFVETRIPLMDDKPFARSLAADAGYRYSDYSLGFKTNTFKFGMEWAPISDIRLRGSFARAVRAPNIGELYGPAAVGLDGATDPCSGVNPTYTAAQCAQTGLDPTLYGQVNANPASQYNGYVGGNPNVKPETATTVSFGIGITPSFVPNLRVQIDYYDINIKDTIASVGADNILNLCLNSNQYCDRIHRDVNGSLWETPTGFVDDPLSNTGQLREKGFDLDASYNLALGSFGKLRTSFVGTYLDTFLVSPVQALPNLAFDCVGFYGTHCGTPNPKWRSTLRLTWMTPWHGLDVTMAWRYFDKVTLDSLSPNANIRAIDPNNASATNDQLLSNGIVSSTDAKLGSRSYLDLSGSIDVSKGISLRLGVNNLLDKSPPIFGASNCSAGQCNGNTFPQVYDALGRYVFATVTAQF